jgi:hypothetical protein
MKKKEIIEKPPVETDLVEFSRKNSLVAYSRLLETITKHYEFVGPDGKAATSKAGLAIQINKKIKQVFGKPVEELNNVYDTDTLTAIRIKIDRVIQKSEQIPLNRSAIKKVVYKAIEDVFKVMN